MLVKRLWAAFLLFFSVCAFGQRSEILLDRGWQFHKGETGAWEKVTVPHDWAIYGPFSRDNDLQNVAVTQNMETAASLKTGRTGGLPYVGVGWYKRQFRVPRGKKAVLLFDGAMSEARVYVNGTEVCFWPYGYNSFFVDVTDYVHVGRNELSVRLENLPNSSRWYPGAGLYRNVHLIITDRVHVGVWGTHVTTPSVSAERASVHLETSVEGASGGEKVVTSLLDPTGTEVASGEAVVSSDGTAVQDFDLPSPSLWSPESPLLYKAVTRVFSGARLCDTYETVFGVRSIELVPGKGFLLNGVPRKFRGVCNHHDLGPLGAAVNEAALRHQLELLKDMGCDAVRTSHNMPAPELVRLCDEMGFMMMLEPFDEWDVPKSENGYHRYFEEWAEKDMVNMLRHYRNHPSVVMWSVGNEVPTQCSPDGARVAKFLTDICHREDPTRPVTCGMDQVSCILSNGFGDVFDVPGLNYRTFRYLEAYEALPQGFILGSETGSTVSSRGVYKLPAVKRSGAVDEDHQCSAYDLDACFWSNVPDVDFALAEDYPWTMGQFVWTGFDYLGEPSPYDTDAWPNHSSMFGIIDLASIPKDRYYLFRSIWNSDSGTLHILPHWNWPSGTSVPVFVYTSYESAELFLNGKSLGVRSKEAAAAPTLGGQLEDLEGRFRLIWDAVPFEPGELKAVAYRGGVAVDSVSVRTAGEPDHIGLECSRSVLNADGKDLAYVTVSVLDKDGNVCPMDSSLVSFKVRGGLFGKGADFRAAANGDPTCLDPFHKPQMHLFSGKCTVILQASRHRGKAVLEVSAPGLRSGKIKVRAL